MYIPEKRLITKIESELKKRMPFLSHWNIRHNKKTGATAPDLLIKTRDSDGHTYCFCVEVKTAGYPQYVRDGIAILKKITKSNPSYYPIVAVGKWLTEKFSRINVFVFVLDFIIEAPFKIFVDIAEQWTKYVKERKEEIM